MGDTPPRPFICPITEERCTNGGCARTPTRVICKEREKEDRLQKQRDATVEAKWRAKIEPLIYERAETELFGKLGRRMKATDIVTVNGQLVTFKSMVSTYINENRERLESETAEIIRSAQTDGWDVR